MSTGGTNGEAPLAENITLNGEGGVIRCLQLQGDPNYVGLMSLAGTIGGSGAFIKTGNAQAWLSGSTPNTYTGGTVVTDGLLVVQNGSSLGTGNVRINGYGVLQLQGPNAVAPGAMVQLNSGPGYAARPCLNCPATGCRPSTRPTPTAYCNWKIPGHGDQPGGSVATALGAGVAGDGTNGNLVLGAQNWADGTAGPAWRRTRATCTASVPTRSTWKPPVIENQRPGTGS